MVLAPNLGEGYQIGCGVCAIIPGNRTQILDLKPLQRGTCGGRPSPAPEGCRTGLAVLNRKFYARCPTPKLFFCRPGASRSRRAFQATKTEMMAGSAY